MLKHSSSFFHQMSEGSVVERLVPAPFILCRHFDELIRLLSNSSFMIFHFMQIEKPLKKSKIYVWLMHNAV